MLKKTINFNVFKKKNCLRIYIPIFLFSCSLIFEIIGIKKDNQYNLVRIFILLLLLLLYEKKKELLPFIIYINKNENIVIIKFLQIV